MLGIVFALQATLVFGLTTILVRKQLAESSVLNVSLILALTGNIVFWPLALLFTDLTTVKFEGVFFFAIAGIASGIFRLIYFKGMERVGASVNSSIFATYPMYTAIFAVLLLNENLSSINWVGIACIVSGVVLIERRLSNPKADPKKNVKQSLIFPVLAALTIAASFIIRKHGLNVYNEPLLGVAIEFLFGFLLYLPIIVFLGARRKALSLRRDFRLFWKASVCVSLGRIFSFYALSLERVAIINSLMGTEPLFVLFFSYMYLKKLEHISLKLVLSTLFIVLGVALVVQ